MSGWSWLVVSAALLGCASAPRVQPEVGAVSAGAASCEAGGLTTEAALGDPALGPVREAPVGDVPLGGACGAGLGACAADGVCAFPEDAPCGLAADGASRPGVCEARPRGCTRDCPRVCACGGETFCNACVARARGFSVKARGACPEEVKRDAP
jgi:hypothetical protein